MCMDVKNGKVTTLEKISNAKNHSLIFTLRKKIAIGRYAHVIYEVRDQFYKGEFKSASAFPLPNTEYTPLYLNAENHTLKFTKRSVARMSQMTLKINEHGKF